MLKVAKPVAKLAKPIAAQKPPTAAAANKPTTGAKKPTTSTTTTPPFATQLCPRLSRTPRLPTTFPPAIPRTHKPSATSMSASASSVERAPHECRICSPLSWLQDGQVLDVTALCRT
ncbi:hypothetical protein C8F01DRAFT_1267279 [Mycena amicta]|nr:hypothetical protein C8F01DRAFT_1267279 [Mycena amicta]